MIQIGLKEIMENAFDDPIELKNLNLMRNSIAKLPVGLFRNLRDLKEINLSYNKIEELSKEIFASNLMLEWIDLSENKIKTIEMDFTALPKIREIILRYNVCVGATFEPLSSNSKTVQELQALVQSL